MFPLLTLSPSISPGPEICFFQHTINAFFSATVKLYFYAILILFMLSGAFQEFEKESFTDSSSNLNPL